jgi:sugar lactone lactonase YvrE
VAGIGKSGYAGDRGPATQARITEPFGIAIDPSGNLFIAEWGNELIRKVAVDGTISTVAGKRGQGHYSGDGGPATKATLGAPHGLAFDPAGNLYIVDNANRRIRKITPDGLITTVAGGGRSREDGVSALTAWFENLGEVAVTPDGVVFIGDFGDHRVRKVTPDGIITTAVGTGQAGFSGDGGPASQAQISGPSGLAVDGKGNLFLMDLGNRRIRRVGPDGMIQTIASDVGGIFLKVDSAGNLFFSDVDQPRVRKVAPDGTITTVAGTGEEGFSGDGGPATAAQLRAPYGITIDAAGNLYIADRFDHRVRKVVGIAAPGLIAGQPFSKP